MANGMAVTRLVGLLGLALMPSSTVLAQQPFTGLEATYQFLVHDRASSGGALFRVTTGALIGLQLPLSFVDDAEYWGAYVCTLPGNACAVTDVYSPATYTLTPQPGPAADLQTERVDVHDGTSIYDAATWQVAVVLGDVRHHWLAASGQDAYALANGQNRLLSGGYRGKSEVRAATTPSAFLYNGRRVTDPLAAFAFRMLSPTWLSPDPLMGTRYSSLITTSQLPADQPGYKSGYVTWSDWKPITGENAWAFLIGPLQAAYLHFVPGERGRYVPFHELAVQNALHILPTFAAMQSPLGAVYYAPFGTAANQGKVPINSHLVSVENNLSLYAGLRILEATLQAEWTNEEDLSHADRTVLQEALRIIAAMIDGGRAVPGPVTKGLLDFFQSHAWVDGEFVVSGLADDPRSAGAWVPTLEPKAVDVNTWGIAALGARRLDQWFGFGAAFRAWQSVKQWGAHGVGAMLWGVGYSDQDGNGRSAAGTYRQGVLSAEWTAGAINAVRNMIRHYGSLPPGSAGYAEAQILLQSLNRDEHDMLEGVQTLRVDRYALIDFPGKPPASVMPLTQDLQPYLYASRRHFIPFGWFANPLPSTCSSAWMIMVAERFDPLAYGGEAN